MQGSNKMTDLTAAKAAWLELTAERKGQRCHALENMFSAAFAGPPRPKKAKVRKPMFPSPEAEAAWRATDKLDKAIWAAASAEEKQAYKSYLQYCRDTRPAPGVKNMRKFTEWRLLATTQGDVE
jgi:hypothetical protein